jgi:hypothetical protein
MTEDIGAEEWRDAPGFASDYQVSDLGRVKSLKRKEPAILALDCDQDGYPRVCLSLNGKKVRVSIHRLVCRAFHGPPNILHDEVAHLYGARANARADNLKWVSKVENHAHKRVHGTHQAGEKHPRAKLTEANVAAIRHASASYGILAERYGVSKHTIGDIKLGKRWGSVHDSAAIAQPIANSIGDVS